MGLFLTVGQLLPRTEVAVGNTLRALDARGSWNWCKCKAEIVSGFDFMNEASVCAFLDHVARLEGIEVPNRALEATRYRNLPWWQGPIWVPMEFATPVVPALKHDGWPLFVGSSHALMRELVEIQGLSGMDLGATPRRYELMRMDLKGSYRFDDEPLNEKSTIQWIWRALFDAATISITTPAPMSAG